MPARRLAATLALAALGSLLAAQAAMAAGQTIDPVTALDNLKLVLLAIGAFLFAGLSIPMIVLVYMRKVERVVGLAAASLIPGIFIFAAFIIPAIARGLADRAATGGSP